MNYNILSPQKIIFGQNSILQIAKLIKEHGKKPLIVTGYSSLKLSGNYDRIFNILQSENIDFEEFCGIKGEPSPEIIDELTEFALNKNTDCIVSIGGGSVIDSGKAVAALITNDKGIENYLEGIGKNLKIKNDPLPFIAVPTTAGSGAEATKNSVITSRTKKYKKSFRDNRMIAKTIIVDPSLTTNLSQNETAFGGMDAICQLIESHTTKNKNNYCHALSFSFISKAIEIMPKILNDPENIEFRQIMSESSLVSGICLANSGLGAVHGFASGIGGMFDIPHGLICAILLPYICRLNSEKDPDLYKELAISISKTNNVNQFIDELFNLNYKLGIPLNFSSFKINKSLTKEIVERSKGNSMNGNPVDFTDEELTVFLENLL
jgi:alcohol dehydrogenase class IV